MIVKIWLTTCHDLATKVMINRGEILNHVELIGCGCPVVGREVFSLVIIDHLGGSLTAYFVASPTLFCNY